MKILNREEFLKMPENTLFFKWDGNCSEFGIKGETTHPDFFMHQFFIWTDPPDDGAANFVAGGVTEFKDGKWHDIIGTVKEFKFREVYGRDGLFDKEQHFAAFEKSDIEQLIGQLQECLEVFK